MEGGTHETTDGKIERTEEYKNAQNDGQDVQNNGPRKGMKMDRGNCKSELETGVGKHRGTVSRTDGGSQEIWTQQTEERHGRMDEGNLQKLRQGRA